MRGRSMFLPFLLIEPCPCIAVALLEYVSATQHGESDIACKLYVALTFCNQGRNGEIFSICPCLETQLKPE